MVWPPNPVCQTIPPPFLVPPSIMQQPQDPYVFAVQLFYLAASAVVFALMLVQLVLASRKEREGVFNTWLKWIGPIFLVQVLVTIAAVIFLFAGAIKEEDFLVVLGQWILVFLAVGAFPGGLLVEQRARGSRKSSRWSWFFTVAVATITVLAISMVWILAVSGFISEKPQTFLDELAKSIPGLIILVPIAILAAPVEEAIFRLGMQGQLMALEKRGWCPKWATLVIPSTIWALGHAGVVTPHGLKEFQIFLVGLVLGVVYRRHGFGACVAVHLGLNCGALLLVPLEMYLFRS
jgi:membrane protease YdiL (CAAX protease family)